MQPDSTRLSSQFPPQPARRDFFKTAPLTIPADMATADILAAMRRDNKRGYIPPRPGHIDMVLLSGLGGAARDGGPFLTQVPERIAAHAINQQLRSGRTR